MVDRLAQAPVGAPYLQPRAERGTAVPRETPGSWSHSKTCPSPVRGGEGWGEGRELRNENKIPVSPNITGQEEKTGNPPRSMSSARAFLPD